MAESQNAQQTPQRFEVAILALQNLTLFPETVVPLGIGRPRSVAAVEAALATEEKLLGCITVRPDRSDDTDAKSGDLYEVGTLVMIKRMERIENGMRIIAQGTERIRIIEWKQEDPFLRATVEIMPEPR
ncbi:MAG TPA: LON peptidase substrate-binding domain-containing protein, partial [Pyrinomonadaceae bacterium]|nr:LON peptidase substrate-binding domain-containing protein [Pyrinomonadaceae bacterium]